jgi:hypothetical protein
MVQRDNQATSIPDVVWSNFFKETDESIQKEDAINDVHINATGRYSIAKKLKFQDHSGPFSIFLNSFCSLLIFGSIITRQYI